jgi:serine/threonine protein kinase
MGLEELLSRLELDGFSVLAGRLIPTGSQVVNQPEEVSSLKRLTKQVTYPDDFSLYPRHGATLTDQATETDAQLAAGLSRRYRIIHRLGQGGMGTVFLAEQIGVGNRHVALKVLNRKLLDDPDFLLRFQNEAASTGRIHHPNVVTIYESAQGDDGTPYIAMEFLEGESLREVLKQRGALPVTEVAEILQQAAGGLNAAHRLGIIHRDLKPDNLFLTHRDKGELVVKVVDFGIAKLRESAMHTPTGTVLGTPAYMSCEQASGMRSGELDARSDIYSLGVVVYEMLTGRTPFHSENPAGYLRMHMQEAPPPFNAVKPGLFVVPGIESVVMKALTKDRSQRYSSVLEFAQDFTQAAEAGSHLAVQPEPQREAAKPEAQTPLASVPKTIVPATVADTVVAKTAPETANRSLRKLLVAGSVVCMVIVAMDLAIGYYNSRKADVAWSQISWEFSKLLGHVQTAPKEQGTKSKNVPKVHSTGRVDWHDKQNWRKYLRMGMTRKDVRELFGEPDKVAVVFSNEDWWYGTEDNAEIQFDMDAHPDGSLEAWFEPER